jgi:hypothetical protein
MNPYIPYRPVHAPELFTGRIQELNELASFLRGSQSVSLVGPRAIGKTSLLFHVMCPATWAGLGLDPNNLFVYIDCGELACSTPATIFGQFAAAIAGALRERGLSPEPALAATGAEPTRLALELALRRLNQRGIQVVLVLDSFEGLSTNKQLDLTFFNALRSIAGRYQLAFLTASTRPLIELTYSGRSQEIVSSPFFNIFASIFLGLLHEDDARWLIREPALNAGVTLSSTTEDFIYGLVGGHPLGLQVACYHAFDLRENIEVIERRTMKDVTEHFEDEWHGLTPAEQDLVRQARHTTIRSSGDTNLHSLLRALVQKCLLAANGSCYHSPSRAWTTFIGAQDTRNTRV